MTSELVDRIALLNAAFGEEGIGCDLCLLFGLIIFTKVFASDNSINGLMVQMERRAPSKHLQDAIKGREGSSNLP